MRIKTCVSRKKPIDFDQRVRKLIAAGANQWEMAAEFGVTRPTIGRWLREDGWIAVTTWIRRKAA